MSLVIVLLIFIKPYCFCNIYGIYTLYHYILIFYLYCIYTSERGGNEGEEKEMPLYAEGQQGIQNKEKNLDLLTCTVCEFVVLLSECYINLINYRRSTLQMKEKIALCFVFRLGDTSY